MGVGVDSAARLGRQLRTPVAPGSQAGVVLVLGFTDYRAGCR